MPLIGKRVISVYERDLLVTILDLYKLPDLNGSEVKLEVEIIKQRGLNISQQQSRSCDSSSQWQRLPGLSLFWRQSICGLDTSNQPQLYEKTLAYLLHR